MNFISLFCGAGGLDLGFEHEEFTPIVAYDIKKSAVASYNFNRNADIAREADLSNLDATQIIQDIDQLALEYPPRGVVGGPPCQYFSIGNRTVRRQDDPRRQLPITYARILDVLNTRYQLDFFIFENVAGLAKPAHRHDFEYIVSLLEEAGFIVFYSILDAYNFGVPQHRERLFIVGLNRNLYPMAEFKFPLGEPSGLTVGTTIEGLAQPQFYARDLDPLTFPEHPNHWTMKPVSEKFRTSAPNDLRRYTRSFRRLSWNEPSYTVAYGHNEIHVHPSGERRLSVFEAMLLQGFPRENNAYRLLGNFTEQVTLVSDAVPPPLAAAIARSLRIQINEYQLAIRP